MCIGVKRSKMDPFEIMFPKGRLFTPIRISGGTTNGRIVNEFRARTQQRFQQSDRDCWEKDIEDTAEQLSQQMSSAGISNETCVQSVIDQEEENNIYEKYNFERRSFESGQLPVYASKDKILKKIAESRTVVIEGATGCGKSTQVSVHFLDSFIYIVFSDRLNTFSMQTFIMSRCFFFGFSGAANDTGRCQGKTTTM